MLGVDEPRRGWRRHATRTVAYKLKHQPCEKHLLGNGRLVPDYLKHIFVRWCTRGVAAAARYPPCRLCRRGIKPLAGDEVILERRGTGSVQDMVSPLPHYAPSALSTQSSLCGNSVLSRRVTAMNPRRLPDSATSPEFQLTGSIRCTLSTTTKCGRPVYSRCASNVTCSR